MIVSTDWIQHKEEPIEVFSARISMQNKTWDTTIQTHGACYMVKFDKQDIRPMFENQIDVSILRQQILGPNGKTLDCPICQPYDPTNHITNHYIERQYLTKIINPQYSDGFIDKEGVWTKCPCLLKGEKQKRLKFLHKGE